MDLLILRGKDNLSSPNENAYYYEGSSNGTGILEKFPKWWDKKQYDNLIWVNRIHLTRSCGDIDLIIPASYDLSMKLRYDGDVGFHFDKHRACKRVAVVDHGSREVLEEYIFPIHPGQKTRKRVFGQLISCRTASHTVGFFDFIEEEVPMDCGDLSLADAHYDLNVGNLTFDLN